jgi:CRP-like cAMP-binding protein
MESLRLASLTHLHSLSLDELDALSPHATELRLPAGHRMLLGGQLHQELAILASGHGLVRCAGETVAEIGAGDVFGELTTRREPYETATVFAVTALHIVVFATHAVRRLRETAPDAVDALLAACSLDPRERAVALAGPRPAPTLKLVAAA